MFKDNIWREFVENMAAENMDDEIEIKLIDIEKLKLLWKDCGNSLFPPSVEAMSKPNMIVFVF